jgi:hypothetical protein
MDSRYLMFGAWLLLGGLLISQIMQSAYFGSSADLDVMNSLLAFRSYNLFGLIPIPLLNISFFTSGLAALVTWDFAFFNYYGLDIFKYFLYVISIALVWGCAATFAGVTFWRSM